MGKKLYFICEICSRLRNWREPNDSRLKEKSLFQGSVEEPGS